MPMMSFVLAAISVATPDGLKVCGVTPPECGAVAVVETTNMTGGIAWRIRYSGGARTVGDEVWTGARSPRRWRKAFPTSRFPAPTSFPRCRWSSIGRLIRARRFCYNSR